MSNYTVIVADGDFPRPGGEARRLLERARRVVACDGAALAYRRRFRRWPDYTVGDFDSCRAAPPNAVRVESQDDNDLAKAGLSNIAPSFGNVKGGIGMVAGYHMAKTKWFRFEKKYKSQFSPSVQQ